MTDLRQAAQQALEAWDDPMKDLKDMCVAMDALRSALEQQAEPVAWPHKWGCRANAFGECSMGCTTHPAPTQQQAEPVCWCHKCNENRLVNNIPFSMTRMILCPTCGNKRCPKASDHRLGCTDSNAAGQAGSAYPALPQQQAEPVTCGYDETTGNCTKNPCCHPTPPQRQWVGLTDEDYLNALDLHPYEGTDREFWNVLETKLKEKNT